MSTTKWIRGTAYAMTLGLLLAAKVGVAATGTWSNDADGNWSTGPWTGSTPGGTAGDTANLNNGNFSLTANRTVTLDQNVKLGTLLLREGSNQQSSDFNWILAQGGANTLTFDNSGSTANLTLGDSSGNRGWFGSNNQINVPVSLNDNLLIQMNGYVPGTPRSTLYFNQAISDGVNGAKKVTVSGGNNSYGYVYLAVSNSFSGGLTLQNIAYVRLTAVGAAGSGPIAIGPNSKLFVDVGQVLNSTISGAGILELANSQALTLGGANSAWTGQLLLGGTPGTITLNHANALSAALIFLSGTTATLTNSTGGALVINQVSSPWNGSALTLNGGDITVNSVSAAASVATTLTLNNNTTIGSLTAGDVTKNGTGKLALTGTVTLAAR